MPSEARKQRSDAKLDPEIIGKLRKQIARWNSGLDCDDVRDDATDKQLKRAPPVTLPRVQKWLQSAHDVKISTKKLGRGLRNAGFLFGKGNRVYNGHEAAANVAYRGNYVKRLLGMRAC